jgi:polyisoprenoid-binding protein YceI
VGTHNARRSAANFRIRFEEEAAMMIRSTIFALTLVAATLCLSPPVHAADTYKIDPRHTSIVFSIGHAGLSYTYGMFLKAGGGYIIDKENPANTRFRLEIQTNSLFTNDAERDEHLRSPDFFDAKQFPTITFESTACSLPKTTPEGAIEIELTGKLTMHGAAKEIKFPVLMLAESAGPQGDHRTGFYSQLELKRSDFGMNALLDKNIVGDAVSITISFEGIRQ